MAYLLVAEDNPVERMVLRAILAKAGHQVFLAEDGEEALDLLSQLSVDLAIVDIQMPGVNGIELMRSYRASGDTYAVSTPILAISADASPKLEQQAREVGANAWMVKPLKADHLRDAVTQLLEDQFCDLPAFRPGASGSDTRTLNRQVLLLLGANVSDPSFVPALIERFVLDAVSNFNVLGDTLRRAEWSLLREAAHAMQGAAGSVGAERLEMGARYLRLASDKDLATHGEAKLLSMQTEFARLRLKLDEFIAETKGGRGRPVG